MSESWIIVSTLLVAGVCLIYFIISVVKKLLTDSNTNPDKSIVLFIKNQERIIEGLFQEIYRYSLNGHIDIYVIDNNSDDQTKGILKRLKGDFTELPVNEYIQGIKWYQQISSLVGGSCIYYIDLSSPVNYKLLIKTIHSIMSGSNTCFYRTRLMEKGSSILT